jgi:hypothetical protein
MQGEAGRRRKSSRHDGRMTQPTKKTEAGRHGEAGRQ